ncbi:intron-encoded endonuclease I-SceI (mitochondrion) [Komagataella phaffii]|uniref:hypothetical protein n=1 Tax=Komagataella phaffii (strain ATCC 76273 / CBS 7435 / CECT 11047 / NRRL Y-11430 / Wegner 21-1) TaxID=981350 RepID=UPI00020490F3|nr:hypothetical protein PP7435_Mit-0250 [Komagataella phaffii CBS 7435]
MKINKTQLIGLSPNNKLLKEYKKQLNNNLSQIQFETAIGLVLGDVYLRNRYNTNYCIQFEWKSKDYMDHINNIFNEYIISPPHKKVRINKNNNEVITWGAQTISHEAFNFLGNLFYKNKIKTIPKNLVSDYVTARNLAYWFMDDGSKYDNNKNNTTNFALCLNTQGFTFEEINHLAKELNLKFDLKCSVINNKNKPVIKIDSSSYLTFKILIDKYIIPSMKYKLLFKS